MARLQERRGAEPAEEDDAAQRPCRGTVRITGIQLPLKVEFVCSSHKRSGRTPPRAHARLEPRARLRMTAACPAAGRPSHYFFVLIRYGPCTIVATPLATAADAQTGDTISFPTSVTL